MAKVKVKEKKTRKVKRKKTVKNETVKKARISKTGEEKIIVINSPMEKKAMARRKTKVKNSAEKTKTKRRKKSRKSSSSKMGNVMTKSIAAVIGGVVSSFIAEKIASMFNVSPNVKPLFGIGVAYLITEYALSGSLKKHSEPFMIGAMTISALSFAKSMGINVGLDGDSIPDAKIDEIVNSLNVSGIDDESFSGTLTYNPGMGEYV